MTFLIFFMIFTFLNSPGACSSSGKKILKEIQHISGSSSNLFSSIKDGTDKISNTVFSESSIDNSQDPKSDDGYTKDAEQISGSDINLEKDGISDEEVFEEDAPPLWESSEEEDPITHLNGGEVQLSESSKNLNTEPEYSHILELTGDSLRTALKEETDSLKEKLISDPILLRVASDVFLNSKKCENLKDTIQNIKNLLVEYRKEYQSWCYAQARVKSISDDIKLLERKDKEKGMEQDFSDVPAEYTNLRKAQIQSYKIESNLISTSSFTIFSKQQEPFLTKIRKVVYKSLNDLNIPRNHLLTTQLRVKILSDLIKKQDFEKNTTDEIIERGEIIVDHLTNLIDLLDSKLDSVSKVSPYSLINTLF